MKSRATIHTIGILLVIMSFHFCSARNNSAENNGNPDGITDSTGESGKYETVPAFPNLEFEQPVELVSPDDGTDRIFVVAQQGSIHVFPNRADVKSAGEFLRITSKVVSGGERGLLGLAFHPDFKNNGYFYVNYTSGDPLQTVISRFRVSAASPDRADAASEVVLLRFAQPYSNHNGGKIAFGNDGYLYISTGDGGSGGDPENRAQNRKELLGKILRIDVNQPAANLPYGIPADNPYTNNNEGFRKEIYAYGMRNAWRFNFDRQTGMLWAGDVGQNRIEEIDIIEKGGNYGWRIMEGEECFKPADCDRSGLKDPIWSYRQGGETGRSVTGGYVCRDPGLPALQGKYIYGDFVSGNIWALTHAGNKAVKNELISRVSSGLSSFGEDARSNLYVLAYGQGKIYRLVAEKK